MKRRHVLIYLVLLLVAACSVGLWSWNLMREDKTPDIHIYRFDRVLDEYVSLGSGTALHRMNTQFPSETKLLIEDVLELGDVSDVGIERELRYYYIDSTVQVLLDEVHRQYADISDLEKDFAHVFKLLKKKDPEFRTPRIYTQISCLNQSIVVSDTLIGISLDKYLGHDFPLYQEFYTPEQCQQMDRKNIVTDAISTYLQYHRRIGAGPTGPSGPPLTPPKGGGQAARKGRISPP